MNNENEQIKIASSFDFKDFNYFLSKENMKYIENLEDLEEATKLLNMEARKTIVNSILLNKGQDFLMLTKTKENKYILFFFSSLPNGSQDNLKDHLAAGMTWFLQCEENITEGMVGAVCVSLDPFDLELEHVLVSNVFKNGGS